MNLRLPDKIEPLRWEVLKKYHQNPQNCYFPRCDKVIKAYRNHKSGLDNNNKDISEFIKDLYFSGKEESRVSCLTNNKFPYLLEPGIQHKVLWFNPRITMSNKFPNNLNTVHGFIDICLSKKLPDKDKYDIVYFENLSQCRSVPGIRHIQVFLKENTFDDIEI